MSMNGLKNLRFASPKTLWKLRQMAIQAVFVHGESRIAVAKTMKIGYSTIRAWCITYQQQGLEALKPKKRGRKKYQPLLKRSSALRFWEVLTLQEREGPNEAKWWTLREVQRLLSQEWECKRSLSQVRRYLKAWGCLPVSPDSKAVREEVSLRKLPKQCVLQLRFDEEGRRWIRAVKKNTEIPIFLHETIGL